MNFYSSIIIFTKSIEIKVNNLLESFLRLCDGSIVLNAIFVCKIKANNSMIKGEESTQNQRINNTIDVG